MIDYKYIEYLEQFVTEKRRNLFKKVLEDRTRHFTIAIEDIFQPHNASALVRSCDIFGVQDMHVIENKYKFYASRLVAKGAQKWIDFSMYNQKNTNNTLDCIENLRNKGYQIIATTPHNESCVLQDFDVSKKYQENLTYLSSLEISNQENLAEDIYIDIERYRSLIDVLAINESDTEFVEGEMKKFNDYLRLFGVDDEPSMPLKTEDADLPSDSSSIEVSN